MPCGDMNGRGRFAIDLMTLPTTSAKNAHTMPLKKLTCCGTHCSPRVSRNHTPNPSENHTPPAPDHESACASTFIGPLRHACSARDTRTSNGSTR